MIARAHNYLEEEHAGYADDALWFKGKFHYKLLFKFLRHEEEEHYKNVNYLM